ncbi:phosphoribosylaminoimidazole carboxylase [Nemania sp. NC0429]|nr:phosphoribosylaminoimidazole carboxylase [Nemania sp. NC0429]
MAKTPVVGLLGGGQLGRMLCQAAAPLGITIAVLDAEDCPAKQINQNGLHVAGSFKDPEKIKILASRCDVLTVEIEHVECDVLEEIATRGIEVPSPDGHGTVLKRVPVHPSYKTIRLIQDKYQQKEYFAKKGLPVAPQIAIESGDSRIVSIEQASKSFGFPFMLKGAKGSYDGRGNFKVGGVDDIERAAAQMGDQPLYAEKFVPFQMELAVMVMRTEDDDGNLKKVYPYPVVETIHEDSICTKVYYPPRNIGDGIIQKAQKVACDVVSHLWGRGVFAVELFLVGDEILVNEVAPRPHNSGHLSIELVPQRSQYRAQLDAILDRVPSPEFSFVPQFPSALMLNILGGVEPHSHDRLVDLAAGFYHPHANTALHLYGKESKPGRKIGHITAWGQSSLEQLSERTSHLTRCVDIIRAERIGSREVIGESSSQARRTPLVAVTMGSDSDLGTLSAGLKVLEDFGVPFVVRITSAHRTPHHMMLFAAEMNKSGCKVIIAAAGGAAHLPGMISSEVALPVIGVPVKASVLDGMDSLLSIVQMPRGIPCATVGIGNSTNAALLAIRILGVAFPEYADKMAAYQDKMKNDVLAKDDTILSVGWEKYLNQKA